MLEYSDLNDNEKRILREKLHLVRVAINSLEDNNIFLMDSDELFEFIYMDEIEKFKDAIGLIKSIISMDIKQEDVNKSIKQKIIEENKNVIKLSDNIYAYKDY